MNEGGDKLVTIGGSEVANATQRTASESEISVSRAKSRKSGRSRKPGPVATVKSGSAGVPVYRSESKGRIRFMVCSYRDGKRLRKVFAAKFPGEILDATSQEIDALLRSLGVALDQAPAPASARHPPSA